MRKIIEKLDWNVFLLCALLLGFGCQAVEYTGRSQMNLVSEGEEKKLGDDAYEDILKKTPASKNQAWQAQLKRVGARISAAAAKPDYQWEFNVLQGKEINAFCLPGGKVAFWEGIMPITQDETGIAVVMGHEVAHALARHGADRMTQSMGAAVVGQILSAGVGMVGIVSARNASARPVVRACSTSPSRRTMPSPVAVGRVVTSAADRAPESPPATNT